MTDQSPPRIGSNAMAMGLAIFWGLIAVADATGTHSFIQPVPDPAQNLAPGERELIYQFPMISRDRQVEPLRYRFTFKGTETIEREPKSIEKKYDSFLDLSLGAADLRSRRDLPRGSVDLVTTIDAMKLLCLAGRGSYTFEMTEETLTERRPNTSTLTFGLDDIYEGSSTLRSIRQSPGALRVNNGALLNPPDPPVLLTVLDCEWMFDLVPMMIPPLPPARIEPGKTWKAGLPIRFSVFAEPRVVRFGVKYDSFDEASGRAVITWGVEMEAASLDPIRGIHHIKRDAGVTGPFRGRLILDAEGRILSSELTMSGKITHPYSRSPVVSFEYSMRLDLIRDEESVAEAEEPLPTPNP